jgi:hypothetical protein
VKPLLSIIGVLAFASAASAEPQAKVRASITTKGDVWVGQRVTLVVELLAPGFFSGAPAFDLPQVPGAVILKPEARPTIGSEMIDDVSYTVQRHEFAVYAQRGGTVTVPGFAVRFEANERFGAPVKAYTVTTPAVSFVAKMPPGAEKLATVITTRQLTVNESWSPEPGAAKIGAAFTRTITVEASDVPGMVLPSFAFDPPAGLRAYPKRPEVSDRVERGELTGRRIETVTYVCEEPGGYELPPLVLAWWNPEEKKLNRARLPGRSFEVAAPPQPPAPVNATPPDRSRPWLVACLLALVFALALAVWRFAPSLLRLWREHETRVAHSERAYFAAFERACDTGNAHAVYRALMAWLDHVAIDPPARTDEFARRAGDSELSSQLAALQLEVFGAAGGDHTAWQGSEFLSRMREARKRLSRPAGGAVRRGRALPPLNPS